MRSVLSILALGTLVSVTAAAPAQANCCNPGGNPCASSCGYGGGFGFGFGHPYAGLMEPSCGTQYYIVNEGPVFSGPGIVTMPAPYPSCPTCGPSYPYVGPEPYQGGYEVAPMRPRVHYRQSMRWRHPVVKHRRYVRTPERVETYEEPYRPTGNRPLDPRDK